MQTPAEDQADSIERGGIKMSFGALEEAVCDWRLEDRGPCSACDGPDSAHELPGQAAGPAVRDRVLETSSRLCADHYCEPGYVRGIVDGGEHYPLHDRLTGNPVARLDDANATQQVLLTYGTFRHLIFHVARLAGCQIN